MSVSEGTPEAFGSGAIYLAHLGSGDDFMLGPL